MWLGLPVITVLYFLSSWFPQFTKTHFRPPTLQTQFSHNLGFWLSGISLNENNTYYHRNFTLTCLYKTYTSPSRHPHATLIQANKHNAFFTSLYSPPKNTRFTGVPSEFSIFLLSVDEGRSADTLWCLFSLARARTLQHKLLCPRFYSASKPVYQ